MAEIKHKTLSRGRKTIVFGMPWYAVHEGEVPRKSAASVSRETGGGHDLAVIRKEAPVQFGLASSAGGAKSGAVAAAAIVADIVPAESWIYVLELDQSIWICCGRDGYILPFGDRVYDRRDEARRAFADLNPASFKKVYLPASWKANSETSGVLDDLGSDIEETNLADFVEYAAPKWGRVTSLSQTSGILRFLAGAVLLGGVVVGAWMVVSSAGNAPEPTGMTPAQLQAARERIEQQQRKEREERYAILDADRPWHRAPKAARVLSRCLDQIKGMPTRPVGYAVTKILCDDRSVDAAVERTTGYSTWLEEWAQDHPGIEVSTAETGDNGYLTRSLGSLNARGAQEMISFDAISREMLTVGQIEGSSVSLTKPAAALVESEPEYVPHYARSEFSISTSRPEAWVEFFADTPGLTVDRVTFEIENQAYTMEGEILCPEPLSSRSRHPSPLHSQPTPRNGPRNRAPWQSSWRACRPRAPRPAP